MQVTSMWLLTVTILLCFSQSNAQEYLQPERNPRYVSSGDSDSIHIQPDYSLYDALRELQSDCSLVLSSGQYQLERYILVSNLSDVRISGKENVVISCNESVGLAFINMTRLVIEGVRIEGCGLSGTNLDHAVSEIRQFIDLFLVVYSEMRVALLLAHCENLQMNRVELYNNVGFGVVGVNIIGTSVISQLTAINNSQPSDCHGLSSSINALYVILQDPDRYGGGAVFIYHDYLSELYNNQFNLLIMEKGMFKNNTECSFNANIYFDYNEPEYYRDLGYRIGGGGGLTLMMAQLNYGIQITTKYTIFEYNRAYVGSGAHVAMFSGTRNTSVEFIDCNFLSNGVPRNLLPSLQIVSGAGLAMLIDFSRPKNNQFTPSQISNTSFRIENSKFLQNISPYGAGLFYSSLYKSNVKDVVRFIIQNSTFEKNIAFSGSAIVMSDFTYHAAYVGTQLEVIDTNISENVLTSNNFDGDQSVQQNTGIVQLRNINMTFRDSCIVKNSGTGLSAASSYVGIDGIVTFSKNVGVRGGAMFLTTFTWLIVLPNASLYLLNNTAREAGGAIYSNFLGNNPIPGLSSSSSDCFLAFSFNNIGPCINCSDLNKTGSFIKLEGNYAPVGSLVFGSTFRTCFWAFDISDFGKQFTIELIAEVFPTVFSFDMPNISSEYFQTQAGRLSAVGLNDTTEFNVLPGQRFFLNCTARDNFNQIVSNAISSFVAPNILEPIPNEIPTLGQNNLALLRDSKPTELDMSMAGDEGKNVSVVIYSTDSIGVARTTININLGYCGLGYMFDTENMICVCRLEWDKLGVTCDEQSLELVKNQGNLWIGPVDDNGSLGVVDCPLQYCNTSVNTIPLVQGQPNFDVQCDPSLFRTGVACGDCQEGRSLVLGTSACLKCSSTDGLIFLLFIALGVALIVFIYFVDITISTGLLNGAIFFSNLVTLYGTFLFPISISFSNFVGSVSFLSLNFGIEVCLYDGMDSVARLWWQLSFPFYLFSLIILIIIVAKIRVSKGVQNPKISVVRAISTLLLLCYVSVLQVAAQLFGFITIETIDGVSELRWIIQPSIVPLDHKSGSNFIVLLIVALFLTVFYLLPFPFFLLFPKLNFKSKHLRKLVPVYDSFWNPFEPKYRWWLGFRLLFRWIPFILTFVVQAPINLFVTDMMLLVLLFLQLTLKPFKQFWVNVLDSVFIAILLVMFTGTLFVMANEKQNNSSDVDILFFNFLISILALFLIAGVFVYHFVIRFPKLEAGFVCFWHKLSCKNKLTHPNENLNMSILRNSVETTFTEIVAIQLREPILESESYCAARSDIT